MLKTKKILFISDLHLQENQPEITAIFLQFLSESDPNQVDAIYILGDLFEAWIGDDDDNLFHRQIIAAFRAATLKGLRIYFLHGNRDFLLGKKFQQQTGCELLADETIISVYGEQALLMHGDTLCTRDLNYLKARKKARSNILQTLFLWLPLWLRRKIANKMRTASSKYTQLANPEIMDVTQEEVVRVLKRYQVKYLIHGHTHRPQIHTVTEESLQATRIVLGAWHTRGNMLLWEQSGKRELIEF